MFWIFEGIKIVEPKIEDPLPSPRLFNPYPAMGLKDSWPRGFPLDRIETSNWNNVTLQDVDNHNIDFGILQSLADVYPDSDAVFRLTRFSMPIAFERPEIISANFLRTQREYQCGTFLLSNICLSHLRIDLSKHFSASHITSHPSST